MSELQSFIINKLKNDPLLVPSPFVNIINRWPRPGGTNIRGASPEFWENDGRMKQAVWVEDMGEYTAPFAEGFGGRRARPNIVAIVHANDAGKAAAYLVQSRLLSHFGKQFYEVGGSTWEFRYGDRLPYEEGAEYGYAGMLVVRFMIEVAGHQPLLVQ